MGSGFTEKEDSLVDPFEDKFKDIIERYKKLELSEKLLAMEEIKIKEAILEAEIVDELLLEIKEKYLYEIDWTYDWDDKICIRFHYNDRENKTPENILNETTEFFQVKTKWGDMFSATTRYTGEI